MELIAIYVLTNLVFPLFVGWAVLRYERRRPKACEHSFVTAQGSPAHSLPPRDRDAVDVPRRARRARAGYLSLPDALALVALYAEEDSPEFDRAAVRWLCRLGLERPELTIREMQLAAAALAALPERERSATSVLTDLSR